MRANFYTSLSKSENRIIKAPPNHSKQAQKKASRLAIMHQWPTLISLELHRTHSCHLLCLAMSRLHNSCLQRLFSSPLSLITSNLRLSIHKMAAFIATVICQMVARATPRTKCSLKATLMANTRPSCAKTGLRQLSVAMRTSAFLPMGRRS